MNTFPALAIVNKCSPATLSESTITHAIGAFQRQITYDFKPHWGVGAKLLYVGPGKDVPPNCWQIWIEDDSDEAGALGYHEVTDEGLPLSRVFARTDATYGLKWSVTATHEILEMLADPWANSSWQTGQYTFHALEVGDPVEDDRYAYRGAGSDVYVTDFILPYWFQPQMLGRQYDFGKHVKKPLELLSGGYASIYDVRRQAWTQKTKARDGGVIDVTVAKPPGDWRRPRVSSEMRRTLFPAR